MGHSLWHNNLTISGHYSVKQNCAHSAYNYAYERFFVKLWNILIYSGNKYTGRFYKQIFIDAMHPWNFKKMISSEHLLYLVRFQKLCPIGHHLWKFTRNSRNIGYNFRNKLCKIVNNIVRRSANIIELMIQWFFF